jgi:hypothetical protein
MYANRYIIQLVMLQPDYNISWERLTPNKKKNYNNNDNSNKIKQKKLKMKALFINQFFW